MTGFGAREVEALRAGAGGADVNDVRVATDRGRLPVLEAALRTDDPELVVAVLDLPGLDPVRALPSHGFWAWARDVSPAVLDTFLERSGVDPGRADADGRTLLLEMAAGDRAIDAATAARLVSAGPVDEPAADGTTPFFHAACHDHVALADALLAAGADPNAVSRGIGWTALLTVVALGRDDAVRRLVAVPAVDVNHADPQGLTPLHQAARLGAADAARELLTRSDADVNRVAVGRRTPLHDAVSAGALPVVELLLARPDVNLAVTDRPQGRTPRELAESLGLTEVAGRIAARERELGPQADTPSNEPPPTPPGPPVLPRVAAIADPPRPRGD
jgi:ankyrin repeat protein